MDSSVPRILVLSQRLSSGLFHLDTVFAEDDDEDEEEEEEDETGRTMTAARLLMISHSVTGTVRIHSCCSQRLMGTSLNVLSGNTSLKRRAAMETFESRMYGTLPLIQLTEGSVVEGHRRSKDCGGLCGRVNTVPIYCCLPASGRSCHRPTSYSKSSCSHLPLEMASSELLKQIQAGRKLKKAETNDRSAPLVDSKPGGAGAGAGPRAPTSAPALPSGGGPPQLGSLFAGGMPRLKPAGQGSLAKPPPLGKPPAVPGRSVPSPAPSAPPPSRATPPKPSTPAPPPPSAPTLPTRAAPALPSRAPAIPTRAPPPQTRVTPSPPATVPAPPRRPPPPPRTASPPAASQAHPPVRPPPSFAVRSPSPAGISSPPARTAPPPPARSSNGIRALPARKAPPPPPARPSSIAGSLPSRLAPPPPARKAPITDGPPALPVHVRALSEAESSAAPPLPGQSPARANLAPPPQRTRVVSSPSEAPSRPSTTVPNRQVNGTRPSAPTRRIPSPPPEAGSHKFPTSSEFPPPRKFVPETKQYGGGRQRGSDFDLSTI
ncbi:hypothetical protein OG21DRAFT_1595063 [Imleria badia]|nr:hypothetical protein OG21DRAFT_1595063 [Imleria badia]